jgi:WD40 repeat protein
MRSLCPAGEILASAGRDGVRLWNLNTGDLITSTVRRK